MARGKKKESTLTPEEKLAQALVPDWEWPYKVPKNWCWVYLIKGAAECLDNFRKPINATERAERKGEIPYYGATGQVGLIDDYLTDEELVLLGEDGAPFLDLIKDKAYLITGKAWVNNHAHILRSYFGSAGNRYLLNYLNSFNYKGYVNGTTRLKLTQASMDNMPVPVPPLTEQQRIVDRIESLFAKLDEAKEKAQAVLDSFETRKAAILHKAFTGELTAKWRAEHGVGMESWVYSTLGIYADSQYGYTESATTEPVGPKFLRITDIQNGHVDWSNVPYCKIDQNKKDQYAIQQGDIVVARTGATTGKSYLVVDSVDAVYASYLIRVSLKSNLLNNRYLYAFMQSPEYWRQISDFSSGIAQPGVNGKKLRELEIPVPSVLEQTESVRILDSLFANEQQAQEAAEAVLEKIDLLKKSILARAFRGELGTNDPSEESAVELLKRVLESDAPAETKKRSKSAPKELREKLETELERKIIHLYFQRETESLPAEVLLSVSSKKFDVLEAIHNLEHRGLVKKLNNGNYRLLG